MKSEENLTAEMKNSEFHKLFIHELKDMYWAENHLSKALSKISKAATSKELASALKEHKSETDNQIKRLEQVFELMEEEAEGETCEAMKGLVDEAEEILSNTEANSMVRDAGIIMACQKVEHYEIASYGSLVHLSKVMDHKKSASLLEETLNEEKKTDALLTKLAEEKVNAKAKQE